LVEKKDGKGMVDVDGVRESGHSCKKEIHQRVGFEERTQAQESGYAIEVVAITVLSRNVSHNRS
jgi:hypothetical protein